MRIRKSCDGVLRPRERLEVRIIAIYSSPKTAKNAKKKALMRPYCRMGLKHRNSV